MKSPSPTPGEPVRVRGRSLEFSLWPLRNGRGGYALNSKLFATDPWPVMQHALRAISSKTPRSAARAFLEQARDFYSAASRAQTAAAKPLLLYYSFLNLAKSLIILRTPAANLDWASHGLAERHKPNSDYFLGAFVEAQPTRNRPSIFDLLAQAMGQPALSANVAYDVPLLLRQIVTGHRLLVDVDTGCHERFLAVSQAQILHRTKPPQIWLRFGFAQDDLTRHGIRHRDIINRGRLNHWQIVSEPPNAPSDHVWIEQKKRTPYVESFIGNAVPPLVSSLRGLVWQTVLSIPPYRRHYILLAPLKEHPSLLPQLLGAYALTFYYGSITRYRPHHFDRILEGPYGAFTETFLSEQQSQLLFLFASEFLRRDVTRPATV